MILCGTSTIFWFIALPRFPILSILAIALNSVIIFGLVEHTGASAALRRSRRGSAGGARLGQLPLPLRALEAELADAVGARGPVDQPGFGRGHVAAPDDFGA